MARPLSYTPETGQVLTLADLSAFVAEAYAKGYPDTAEPRFTGALEVNFTHGPRATRITVLPEVPGDRD